jgi:hypothetical protein
VPSCSARGVDISEVFHDSAGGTGGQYDENWADWYAEHIVRELSGEELPQ